MTLMDAIVKPAAAPGLELRPADFGEIADVIRICLHGRDDTTRPYGAQTKEASCKINRRTLKGCGDGGGSAGGGSAPLRGKACKAPLPALACGSFQLHINQRQRKEGAWLPSID